ncbi:membrane protein [Amycolatopsis jejuensis]|uniref:membrane protein n=1 Tax=Amycolatopsis jejuensis TaxID=330084 RepID=UPI000524AB66|nr:membrane protein [Amycolatopsis jejuensis]
MSTSNREPTGKARTDRLPVWRIGLAGGLVGILCCVGPTVLALLGVVGAGTAFAWATNLYGGYAWWFRLGGLLVLTGLIWRSLRRRNQCSVAGLRRWRWRLLAVLGIAVGVYAALYAVTTWLGAFA